VQKKLKPEDVNNNKKEIPTNPVKKRKALNNENTSGRGEG
jgi:hypothetical protein